MLPSFHCIYFFGNQQILILEIKRTDLSSDSVKADTYKWLLVEKSTEQIIQLDFLAMHTTNGAEERFFRQGYLSFDTNQAVYIREASSVQEFLDTFDSSEISRELNLNIQRFLNLS